MKLVIQNQLTYECLHCPDMAGEPQHGAPARRLNQLNDRNYLFDTKRAPKTVRFRWEVIKQRFADRLLLLDKTALYTLTWQSVDRRFVTLENCTLAPTSTSADTNTRRAVELVATAVGLQEEEESLYDCTIDLTRRNEIAPIIQEFYSDSKAHIFLDGSQINDISSARRTEYTWSVSRHRFKTKELRKLLATDQTTLATVKWRETDRRVREETGLILVQPESDDTSIQSVRLTLTVADPPLPAPIFGAVTGYMDAVRKPRLFVQRYTATTPMIVRITFLRMPQQSNNDFITIALDGVFTLTPAGPDDFATLSELAGKLKRHYNCREVFIDQDAGGLNRLSFIAARPGTPIDVTFAAINEDETAFSEEIVQPNTQGSWAEVPGVLSSGVSNGAGPLDRQVASSASIAITTILQTAVSIGQTYRLCVGLDNTVEVLFTGTLGEESGSELEKSTTLNLRDFVQLFNDFTLDDLPPLIDVTPTDILVALVQAAVKQLPDTYPPTGEVWISDQPEPDQWWAKVDPLLPRRASDGLRVTYTLAGFYVPEATSTRLLDVLGQTVLCDSHTIRFDSMGRLLVLRPSNTAIAVTDLNLSNVESYSFRKGDQQIVNDVTVTSAPFLRSFDYIPVGETYTLQTTTNFNTGNPTETFTYPVALNWAINRDVKSACRLEDIAFPFPTGTTAARDRRTENLSITRTFKLQTNGNVVNDRGDTFSPLLTPPSEDGPTTTADFVTYYRSYAMRDANNLSGTWAVSYVQGEVVLDLVFTALGKPLIQPNLYTVKMRNENSRRAYGVKTKDFRIDVLAPFETLDFLMGAAEDILTRYSAPNQYCDLTIPGRLIDPTDFVNVDLPALSVYPALLGRYKVIQANHTSIKPGDWSTTLTIEVFNPENVFLGGYTLKSSIEAQNNNQTSLTSGSSNA